MAPARSVSGNHAVTSLLQIGNEGASKSPRRSRSPRRARNAPAKPCIRVASDHRPHARAQSTFGFTRSTSQPPGIWKTATPQLPHPGGGALLELQFEEPFQQPQADRAEHSQRLRIPAGVSSQLLPFSKLQFQEAAADGALRSGGVWCSIGHDYLTL